MARKILLYSIPFGFGPTGKAIVIASHLSKTHNVQIATFANSLHLFKKSISGMNIFDCHSRNTDDWKACLFQEIDTLISIMDLQVIRSVKSKYPHIKTVFIDSLLSWRIDESWSNFLEDIKFIDFYIAQYFPGTETLQEKYPNIHIVSPILSKEVIFKNKSKLNSDHLLIHYGGLSSPSVTFQQCLPFLERTTEIIINEFYAKTRLVFAGNIELMEYLRTFFKDFSNVIFDCFSHTSFQEFLSQSMAYITTPGIESSYESFFLGKPTLFLPPTNSTQLHQIKKFLDMGCLSTITTLNMDILEDIDSREIEYSQKTLELCNFCNKVSTNRNYQNLINSDIYALTESEKTIRQILDSQEKIVPSNLEDGLCLLDKILKE